MWYLNLVPKSHQIFIKMYLQGAMEKFLDIWEDEIEGESYKKIAKYHLEDAKNHIEVWIWCT